MILLRHQNLVLKEWVVRSALSILGLLLESCRRRCPNHLNHFRWSNPLPFFDAHRLRLKIFDRLNSSFLGIYSKHLLWWFILTLEHQTLVQSLLETCYVTSPHLHFLEHIFPFLHWVFFLDHVVEYISPLYLIPAFKILISLLFH